MSVLPIKADIRQRGLHVRLVPLADIHLRGWPATLVLAKLRSTTTNLWTWGLRKRASDSRKTQLRTDVPMNGSRRLIETATTACLDITHLSLFRRPGLT